MKLQVIRGSNGKATGVFIPISDWKKLKKQFAGLKVMEEAAVTKHKLIQELKEAVLELKQIEEGSLKSRPAKALLDEL